MKEILKQIKTVIFRRVAISILIYVHETCTLTQIEKKQNLTHGFLKKWQRQTWKDKIRNIICREYLKTIHIQHLVEKEQLII